MAKYSITLAAIDKFSAPFKSFEATSGKLSVNLRGQQAEIRKLNSAARELKAFDSMKLSLGRTSDALKQVSLDESALSIQHSRLSDTLLQNNVAIDAAKQKHHQLGLQIDASEKPTREMLRSHREAGKAVKELEKDHKELNKQLDVTSKNLEKNKYETVKLSAEHRSQAIRLGQLEKSLSKAGVDAHKFADEQKRIEQAAARANVALKTQQARLKSVSDAQSRVDANRSARADLRGQVLEAAAIGYVAAQPIRKAINYESSMADVKKVVDFKDDAEVTKMGRDILKMSTSMPIAAAGIAEIVSAAGQSGVAKAELLDFATSAAKMSTAFDVSAEDAGSTMAGWRASMGLSQSKAVSLADATNHLSNNMNASAKDIAGVLKRQGAVAMSAGLGEIQAASLSAALLSGGAGEEVAATALKNITGSMMKGDTGSAKQQDAWAELGFDPNQLAGDMLSDAPATMISVFEAMQDVPEERVSVLVSTLFGEEVKGSVMPMLKNLDNLRNSFDMTSDATKYRGSMEDEYRARSATTANTLQLLTNKFDRLQIGVGTLLLPALNDFIGPIADGVDVLADAAEKYPKIAKGIAMVGVGLVGLKVGALALKMVGLQFGQGINSIKLGRAKLAATTGATEKSATRADRALRRMNATMDRMGRRRSSFGGRGSELTDIDVDQGGKRQKRKGRRRVSGKLGGVAGLASLVAGGSTLSTLFGEGVESSVEPVVKNLGNLRNSFDMTADSTKYRSSMEDDYRARSITAATGLQFLSDKFDRLEISIANLLPAASVDMVRPAAVASAVVAAAPAPALAGISSFALASADMADAAMTGADAAGATSDLLSAAPQAALKVVGKIFKPLDLLLSGAALTSSIASGSSEDIGATSGDIVGGLGGSIAGGMAGAAIGSVIPIVGTVIGGIAGSIIGGLGGGSLGEWAGGEIGSWFGDDKLNGKESRLPAPEVVQKELSKGETKKIVFSPTITMPGSSGDKKADEQLLDRLLERMRSDFVPLMGGGDLSVRMDATMTDGGEL